MPKKSKKADIIDTATVLFAGKGFANTSMAEVASLTGIAGATIFYHFKTKEELFVSVLENVKTGLVQAFSLYFQEEHFPTGLERLLGAVAYHLHLSEIKKEWFLLLRRHYTHELAAVHPACRRHLEVVYTCLVEIFEKALTIDPKSVVAHLNLGNIYLSWGNLEKAIEHNFRAIQLKPEFGMAHNNLAVSYFQNHEIEKAKIHAHKAISLGYDVHPEFLILLRHFKRAC